jgi:HK97 family phage portal protein
MKLRSRINLVKRAFGMVTAVGSSLANWFSAIVNEPCTGAWQKEIRFESNESLLRNSAIYACVTGIAADVSKMRIKLSENVEGIWTEITKNQPWLTVLKKPNDYQNRIQFLMQWIISKLLQGNAYIYLSRDARGIVNEMHVLDPHLVTPLVTADGAVYYSLNPDPLAGITEASIVVPSSEIIHDRMPPLWHPLVGVPPIYACAMSGSLGNKIQKQAIAYFDNQAMPGGVLTIPGDLEDTELEALKAKIALAHAGDNRGKMMVLSGGMTFAATQNVPKDTQLAEVLKLSVEEISRAYHYPIFKLGGPVPTLAGNVESLITTYYTDCLQHLVESVELCLDEGLSLPTNMGTELDLDNLLRMDMSALYEANNKAVNGGWMKPDEARFRANMKSVPGGNTPYMQQQNYSLAALAKRDAKADPFATSSTPKPAKPAEPAEPAQPNPPPPPPKSLDDEEMEWIYAGGLRKQLMGKEIAA